MSWRSEESATESDSGQRREARTAIAHILPPYMHVSRRRARLRVRTHQVQPKVERAIAAVVGEAALPQRQANQRDVAAVHRLQLQPLVAAFQVRIRHEILHCLDDLLQQGALS